MYRMTILYGTPPDPAAFRRYYLERHVPLAGRMQGLSGWNLQWLGDGGPYLLVAELQAESRQAMDAVLASPEGVAAREDVARFATGGVQYLTGEVEEVAFA